MSIVRATFFLVLHLSGCTRQDDCVCAAHQIYLGVEVNEIMACSCLAEIT